MSDEKESLQALSMKLDESRKCIIAAHNATRDALEAIVKFKIELDAWRFAIREADKNTKDSLP